MKYKTEWRAACPRTDGRGNPGAVMRFEWVYYDTKEECENLIQRGLDADENGTWSEREQTYLQTLNKMTGPPVIQSRKVTEWTDNE